MELVCVFFSPPTYHRELSFDRSLQALLTWAIRPSSEGVKYENTLTTSSGGKFCTKSMSLRDPGEKQVITCNKLLVQGIDSL